MTLDFTNYTFSGLISLLSAILGIGYPLFLESIRKIDEQYDSTRLSAKFQRESVFKWYRCALIVSIGVSFCAPFLMLLFPFDMLCIIIITIQTLVVLWLVFMMLSVFQMVQDYYNPNQIIDSRFGNPLPPNDLFIRKTINAADLYCLIDTMRYAARRNNREVYMKCKSLLIYLVNQESKDTKDGLYNASQDIYNAFRLIADYSKDVKILFIYNDNLVSQAFYNYLFDYHLGPKTYELLWISACIVAEGGSDEWFRQQWSNAVQYYLFRYKQYPDQYKDEKDKYLEHHFMLGVLSIFYKRFDWLNIVLFHTYASPPKYPLVPSTLITIIDTIKQLESQREQVWKLTNKYQMKGLLADVNSDDKLLFQTYRYAALLLIRLFSVNDYNITYSDPLQSPQVDHTASIYKLKEEIKLIEHLYWHVNSWYKGNDLSQINLPILPSQADVLELLGNYKKEVEDRINDYKHNPVLDKEKMEDLKSRLTDADNRMKPSIPPPVPESSDDKETMISIRHQLDNEICTLGSDRGWSNFPEVLLKMLNDKLESYYDGLLRLIPSEIFTINESNIFKALKMFKLDNVDVIMSLGVYLPNIDMIYNERPMLSYKNSRCFFNNNEILVRHSNQSSIIIIKQNLLPTIAFLPPSEDMQRNSLVELTNSQKHLCTNIDKIIEDEQPMPIVCIGRNIRSQMHPKSKCIRIVVKNNVDDTLEFERLKQFINS